MISIKNIDFPKNEINDLKNRLDNNKSIYTTRVSKQYNIYKQEDIVYNKYLGLLKVINVYKFKDVKNHPFYNELTDDQIKELSNYTKMELIELIKITKRGRY